MECKQKFNMKNCTCTYEPCERKGVCCDCIRYHIKNRQLPGCVFDETGEKSYDRSYEHFAKLVMEGRV